MFAARNNPQEFAAAKINLYLHVTGKRADGYHLLESLVAFADVGDVVTAQPADALSFEAVGDFAAALGADVQQNLVLKAAQALQQKTGIVKGAALRLEKKLPIGSGIGGGSADAAAALRLLIRFWDSQIKVGELLAIGLELGADVPMCLFSKPAYVSGVGEQLQHASALPPMHVLLVNPGKSLLTADVFRQLQPPYSLPSAPVLKEGASFQQCVAFLRNCRNDLQKPAIQLMPEIANVLTLLDAQDGCSLARMSGSGATCFGLFKNREMCDEAAEKISRQQPRWWVRAAALLA